MIIHSEPLSMVQAEEYINKQKDSGADVISFIGKFTKLKPKEANDLKKKLEDLKLIKLKKEHLVKIIDLMPENTETLNKIFVDISLDEDETKKILNTIREFI